MNLSKHISYNQKKTIVEKELTPGRIFYLFCNFKKNSCDKYLVLACISNNIPFFFIVNTQIPHFIKKNSILRDAQIKLNARDYRFLRYDSYLNCCKLVDHLSKTNIINQIIKKNTRLLPDRINVKTRQEILKRINRSKTIEKGIISEINAQL